MCWLVPPLFLWLPQAIICVPFLCLPYSWPGETHNYFHWSDLLERTQRNGERLWRRFSAETLDGYLASTSTFQLVDGLSHDYPMKFTLSHIYTNWCRISQPSTVCSWDSVASTKPSERSRPTKKRMLVFLGTYICIYSHIYVNIYIYVCIHTLIIFTSLYHIHICMHCNFWLGLWKCNHIHVYVCVHTYMYIYIYVHLFMHTATYITISFMSWKSFRQIFVLLAFLCCSKKPVPNGHAARLRLQGNGHQPPASQTVLLGHSGASSIQSHSARCAMPAAGLSLW